MANWISEIVSPHRLVLAWQAPDEKNDRFRWAVGWVEVEGEQLKLQYSSAVEFEQLNAGRPLERAVQLGFQGYPGFPLSQNLHTAGVRSALMRRLPPRARSDFREYAEHFRLSANLVLSDLAMLGYTEAKLPSDGFSLVDPFEDGRCTRDLLLEVAGRRYYPPSDDKLGEAIAIENEEGNQHDAAAVMFTVGGRKIGNINRLQAPAFRRWLAQGCTIDAELERINGSPSRPRAFVFVRVRSSSHQQAA